MRHCGRTVILNFLRKKLINYKNFFKVKKKNKDILEELNTFSLMNTGAKYPSVFSLIVLRSFFLFLCTLQFVWVVFHYQSFTCVHSIFTCKRLLFIDVLCIFILWQISRFLIAFALVDSFQGRVLREGEERDLTPQWVEKGWGICYSRNF